MKHADSVLFQVKLPVGVTEEIHAHTLSVSLSHTHTPAAATRGSLD